MRKLNQKAQDVFNNLIDGASGEIGNKYKEIVDGNFLVSVSFLGGGFNIQKHKKVSNHLELIFAVTAKKENSSFYPMFYKIKSGDFTEIKEDDPIDFINGWAEELKTFKI